MLKPSILQTIREVGPHNSGVLIRGVPGPLNGQLNSVSTDYANLCNLWITTSSCQATLSQLPSNRACCHLSHNSAAAFLPSKFRSPVSTKLLATPERALKNLAARGKQPHTEESSDGRLQAAPARASQYDPQSNYRRSGQPGGMKAQCKSAIDPSHALRRISIRTPSRTPDNHHRGT